MFIVLQNASSALTVILARQLLLYVQPVFYVGMRMTVSGILLLGYHYITDRGCFVFRRAYLWPIIQIAVIQLYLTYLLDTFAVQRLSAARVTILYNLSPFIAAFFSYVFFAEVMTRKKWVGLIVGLMGFLPILMRDLFNYEKMNLISIAGLALLGAVIGNTYGYIVLRDLVKKHNCPPIMVAGLAMLISGVMAFGTSLLIEDWSVLITDFTPFITYFIPIVLIGNIIAYTFYAFLLKKYTATFLSFTAFLYPVFGAFFGWIFLHEEIGWHFMITLLFVIIGLFIFYKEELRQGYIVSD